MIALVVLGVANILLLYNSTPKTAGTTDVPKLDATIISASSCEKCFNASVVISAVEGLGAKVKIKDNLDVSSSKASSLIKRYNITKVPTVLFSGDTKDAKVSAALATIGETRQDGTVVVVKITPPYYDTVSKRVTGLVGITSIGDKTCAKCYDPVKDVEQLKGYGVAFGDKTVLDYTDSKAQILITKYNITHIPAILFTGDIKAYSELAGGLAQVGTYESDGTYVLRSARPPYRSLPSGNIDGLVSVTYLTDNSCASCYNVSVHKSILVGLGLYLDKETTTDVSTTEGRALVSKYNITVVPTIIVSKEGEAYPPLMQVWPEVGTIESDGSFVFRNVDAMGKSTVYKNLTTGMVVGNSTVSAQ